MQCDRLFEVIDSLEEKYINIWEDVCNIESPTSYKPGIDKVGEYFIKIAKAKNWKIEVLELEKLKNDDGITCNCGVITGGTVPNAVAAECSFFADIRFKDKEEFDKAIEIVHNVADNTTIDGCCCDVEQVSYRPAMPLTDVNIMLLDKINAIYKLNDLAVLKKGSTLAGSDAAYITQIAVPCVDCVGVEGENIHSVNEFAKLKSLKEAAKRLASVAYCI